MSIRITIFRSCIIAVLVLQTICSQEYRVVDEFSEGSFFDNFDFFNLSDPSHGFVSYVTSLTATERGYTGFAHGPGNETWAYIGVEQRATTPAGRPSVRVTSKKSWTHGLIIADIHAVPSGCSLWPAFWMVNPGPWPGSTGEIDIFEAVHTVSTNSMTLHTSYGCAVSNKSDIFSGEMRTCDCNVLAPTQYQNAGCSIQANVNTSAGQGFNAYDGGIYVTEWTSTNIKVFFFSRNEIPKDIADGHPQPSLWTKKPLAYFVGSTCAFDQHLSNLSLVINTNFCGDWAGETWSSSGCAVDTGVSSCQDFVANTPNAFDQAYWLIKSIKIYQQTDAGIEQASEQRECSTQVS